MSLSELALKVYHEPTQSFQFVARIDFENSTLDFFDDDDKLVRDIPFQDCQLNRIFFRVVEDE